MSNTYASNTQSMSSATAPEFARLPHLEMAINRVRGYRDELEDIVAHASKVAERLVGPKMVNANTVGAAAVPSNSGQIGELEDALSEIPTQIATLRDALARIDRL